MAMTDKEFATFINDNLQRFERIVLGLEDLIEEHKEGTPIQELMKEFHNILRDNEVLIEKEKVTRGY